MSASKEKLKVFFLSSFLFTMAFTYFARFFEAIDLYLHYCERGGPEIGKDFPDFFYFIGFAKAAFAGGEIYPEANQIIKDYLCSETIDFGFSYPPTVLNLTAHLALVEKFFGLHGATIFVFISNIAFCILMAWLLQKITKLNFIMMIAILFTSNLSYIALKTGQLSVSFALILVSFFYFYQKGSLFWAGALLSLFAIKPQIGLLLGLFAFSNPRLLLGAVSGFLGTHLVTFLLAGSSIYQSYYQSFFVEQDKSMFFLARQSIALPAILWRVFDISDLDLIIVAQAIFVLCALALTVFLFYKDTKLEIESKLGLLVFINILITPYILMYDFFLCIPAVLLLAKQFYQDKIFLILSFLFLYGVLTPLKIYDFTTDTWFFTLLLACYVLFFKSSLLKSHAK